MTLQLRGGATGVVGATVTAQVKPPDLPLTFKAGTYVNPGDTRYGLVLAGPSAVTGSAMVKWQTSPSSKLGQVCGAPAVFYVGPVKNNPLYATRLKPAGIASPEYSYGIIQSLTPCARPWQAGSIVGVSQSGAFLTIATFTDAQGADAATPQDLRTYRLQ